MPKEIRLFDLYFLSFAGITQFRFKGSSRSIGNSQASPPPGYFKYTSRNNECQGGGDTATKSPKGGFQTLPCKMLLYVQAHMYKFILTLIFLLCFTPVVYASGAFPVDGLSTTIIGFNGTYTIKDKETLIELARDFGVGYNEISAANSGIDPWVPEKGTEIIIPTRWLLPDIVDNGIVINIAEMRLYYFFSAMGNRYVKTFPIGIGTEGADTPIGSYSITAKVKDPVWRIPKSIRAEYPDMPDFVPPGPDNPLGRYWLQLSDGYGIHGTNRPLGIGRKVSHGCIRMYPEDIEVLFRFVERGEKVKIVNEPVKTGIYNGRVYVEIHRSHWSDEELLQIAMEKLSRKPLIDKINMPSLLQEIKSASGLPAVISN